eukprot:928831-Rhodomonas_salina.6
MKRPRAAFARRISSLPAPDPSSVPRGERAEGVCWGIAECAWRDSGGEIAQRVHRKMAEGVHRGKRGTRRGLADGA